MNNTPFAPISLETLMAAAARAGPQAAVLLTLMAHQDQDHRLRASLAELASQTRYPLGVALKLTAEKEEPMNPGIMGSFLGSWVPP